MRRDLTNGSVTKNILHLAWPMMVAFTLHVGFNLIDTIFVGRYSALALASISITFPVIFLIIALASGVGIGVTSFIARLIGAKKVNKAKDVAKHGLILAFFMWIFFVVAGLAFAKPLFMFLGAEGEILSMSLKYAYTIFIGSFFMFFAFIGNSILRGEGDTKTPMKIMALATVVNIILDPLMIFGLWVFPELGIFGAALATVIARSISAFVILGYLFKGNALVKLDFKLPKFDFRIIKEIFEVGIPASLSQSVMSLGMFFMMKIVSFFGPYAIAAYGLLGRLDSVAILPALGIGSAVITIVGQNVGAKKFDRAEGTVWKSGLLAAVFMECVGIIFFIMPRLWITIFNKHPDIISYGVSYLRIVSLTYAFIGLGIIIGAAFQGAGKGYPSLMLTIIRLFVLNIPLALIFAFVLGLGLEGVWMGIMTSIILSGIISAVWFKLGTWKKGKHIPVEMPEGIEG
ncbi:MATE family efflux transporter [Candidatus Woesearchaeota archaeon]|nr:MATE family efflux transporter [Candidatus Woesearchaeota archaeon]